MISRLNDKILKRLKKRFGVVKPEKIATSAIDPVEALKRLASEDINHKKMGTPRKKKQENEEPLAFIKPESESVEVGDEQILDPPLLRPIKIMHQDASPIIDKKLQAAGISLSCGSISRGKASCIVGLDFGTAFTKACVRFRERSVFVVDWNQVVKIDQSLLLPCAITEYENGVCVLGTDSRGVVHEGLKMQLLHQYKDLNPSSIIAFLALVTRYIRGWLFTEHESVFQGFELQWEVNVGLPASPWESSAMKNEYQRIVSAAWELGASDNAVTLRAASMHYRDAKLHQHNIEIIPEFVAQIAAYIRSPRRQPDLHALVDIGAGTVDVVTFNVHDENEEQIFPIFEAEVKPLGTHFLLANRVACLAIKQDEWNESDATLSDDAFIQKFGGKAETIKSSGRRIAENLADTINSLLRNTKVRRYPRSQAWKNGLPVFVCGGGRDINVYRSSLDSLFKGWNMQEVALLAPLDMQPKDVTPQAFHRISVAYGLSFRADDLGRIKRRRESPDIPLNSKSNDYRDRFIDKDQM